MRKIFLLSIILQGVVVLSAQDIKFQSYIGKWKVDNIFVINEDYLGLGDFTKEQAYAYMGAIIEYDKKGIIFANKKFINQRNVEESFFTDEQLKSYTTGTWYPGYSFKDLRITNKIIKEINIYIHDEKIDYYVFGSSFYQINNDEIIITYHGWFYHAVRIS